MARGAHSCATGLRGERAYADTLAHDGRVLEPDVLPALAGASVARAAAQLEVPADELRRRLFGAFREERHAVLRGARELVEKLRRRSLLAVAMNAPADLVQETLADVGLIDSFELIVSAETLPHREKPAPDVYIQACVELDVAPDHAIAFEDSPIGALRPAARDWSSSTCPRTARSATTPTCASIISTILDCSISSEACDSRDPRPGWSG
jgi:HAD superfamily hydrolase (TIGR01509 family)